VLGRQEAFTAICDQEALESKVYPNRCPVFPGFGSLSDIADEHGVPLTALPFNGHGLNSPDDRTMQLDLNVSDVLEVQPAVVLELASVAVGRKLYGIKAVPPLEGEGSPESRQT
jgi:hypothetical protein